MECLQGVPLRLEIGPRDVKQQQFVAVRRDTGEKETINEDRLVKAVSDLLENVHKCLYER